MVLADLGSGTVTKLTTQTAVYVSLELELDDNNGEQVIFWFTGLLPLSM